MKEIEIKILEINKEEIEKKLTELGAISSGRKHIVEKAFDFPDRKIQTLVELCRIRKFGDKIEFTYKHGVDISAGIRSAEELEVEVSDFDTLEKILNRLGLSTYYYREKYRTSWQLYGAHIEIDECPHIPPFLEIEGAEDTIKKITGLLGYTMDNTSTLTVSGVYQSYGLDSHNQFFDKKLL